MCIQSHCHQPWSFGPQEPPKEYVLSEWASVTSHAGDTEHLLKTEEYVGLYER